MNRKIIFTVLVLLLYQVCAAALLFNSSYLNIVYYYTHPPHKGEVGLRRLPLLFGDEIAHRMLRLKHEEAAALINDGKVGMAAILSSYEHNQVLSVQEAKFRTIQVAELFINAGYDLSQCEVDGRSTAAVLQSWELLDNDIEGFLVLKAGGEDIFSCR